MGQGSSFDAQFLEMSRRDRLGERIAEPVVLDPPSLKYYAGSIFAIVVAVVLLGIFAFLYFTEEAHGVGMKVLLWSGVGFGALAGVLLARRALSGCVLEVHKEGFMIKRRFNEKIILFQEIMSLAVKEREQLDNGVRVGMNYRLVIRSSGGKAALKRVSLDQKPDLFGGFVHLLIARTADAAEARIMNGDSMSGRDWRLDAGGLHIGKHMPIALSAIGEAGIFEDKVSIWQGAEALPVFSVKADSPGARVLLEIVARHLPEKKPEESKTGESLGRILFRKRAGATLLVLFALVGIGMLAGGIWMLGSADQEDFIYAILAVALGTLLTIYMVYALTTVFEIHGRGVAKRSLIGRRSLMFKQIEKFKYEAIRQYHNGIYTGTSVSMKFVPMEKEGSITFSSHIHGNDADLDLVREHISGVIAEKLYERLSHESEVPWGRSARLSKKGVHFSARKFFGKGEPMTASFSEDLRYAVEDGMFHLFIGEQKKPVMKMNCSEENFFPGFLLFGRLVAEVE